MTFGFIFGPIAGFLSGLVGSIIADQISFGNVFWNWELGNGLIGLIPSLGYFIIRRSSWGAKTGLAASSVLAIVASLAGAGFSALTEILAQSNLVAVASTIAEFVSVAATDIVNGAILTPVLIYAYVRSTARRAKQSS